ncbi:MAG: hypothetical protein FWG45_06760 [Oscillospiraceae bacterium]|nr:hypothetical protein [Oscillospiraceae bacterium]
MGENEHGLPFEDIVAVESEPDVIQGLPNAAEVDEGKPTVNENTTK